ncbi:flagellar biosynthetic protein FliQ (plasmid) [Sphingomonas paeninsulae]|jgi:flagellar biosynthetic protein FliQ|uniref:Flagellar biosynthetic protein FliQ n=1 Tax=Sphingomonas paeninsulae TaxID=2319844 RepID=A0A494TII9_SPHPE|nr:flagellar biosynthetic protein FliQ [Sphingomonas paeninsulae]AYJ85238.1 flagellar biosynthetic protein FliQ [Sphingomonas paeninsulae]
MGNEQDILLGFAQQGLWTAALASAPLLIPVLVVGIAVGLFQAVTSINEATLSFVPKLLVVALVLALFGATILGVVADFAREMYARIPDVLN